MSEWKDQLSQFDNEYQEAPDTASLEVPDGTYSCNVDKVEIAKSSKDNPMVKWTLRVTDGDYSGRIIWKYSMIATKQNVHFLKVELVICGIDLPVFSDLEDHLADILDVELEVKTKKKDDFLNVYFVKRLDTKHWSPEDDNNKTEKKNNDDVPF